MADNKVSNKYEFKRMLKQLVDLKGLDFIMSKPALKKQWEELGGDDEATRKLFDVDGAFKSIDPRNWKSYIDSIKSGNTPDTILWDLYTSNKTPYEIQEHLYNAKDIYPDEMADQSNNPHFYDIGHTDGWKGTDLVVDPITRQPLADQGLQRILDQYGITQDEYLKLLMDETNKRRNEKLWDLDNPENWKGETFLGLDIDPANDSYIPWEKALRGLIKFSADNFWDNTVNDYRTGRAQQEGDDYGIFGLNTGDVVLNGIDVATSPVSMGKGKVLKVLGGIGGIGTDIAMPFAREGYNSSHNGTEFSFGDAFKDMGIRLGGRGVGNASGEILNTVSKATEGIAPGVSKYVGDLDKAAHSQKRVQDNYNVFMDDLDRQAMEQSGKQFHVDLYASDKPYVIEKPRKGNSDITKSKSDYTPSTNANDYANMDDFMQVGKREDGTPILANKLDRDAKDMESFLDMKNSGKGELTKEQIARIRELQAKYPEFKEMYSFVPTDAFGKNIVKTVDAVQPYANVPLARTASIPDSELLDVDGMKNTADDFSRISRAYNNIPEETRKAIEAGDYSLASEYDRKIANKYFELLAQQPYQVKFY